jgi:hypothetical protein
MSIGRPPPNRVVETGQRARLRHHSGYRGDIVGWHAVVDRCDGRSRAVPDDWRPNACRQYRRTFVHRDGFYRAGVRRLSVDRRTGSKPFRLLAPAGILVGCQHDHSDLRQPGRYSAGSCGTPRAGISARRHAIRCGKQFRDLACGRRITICCSMRAGAGTGGAGDSAPSSLAPIRLPVGLHCPLIGVRRAVTGRCRCLLHCRPVNHKDLADVLHRRRVQCCADLR